MNHGAFWSEFKKVRKWISHCIFKNQFARCWGLFSHLRAQIWYTSSYECPEEPQGEDRCLPYLCMEGSEGTEVTFVKLTKIPDITSTG